MRIAAAARHARDEGGLEWRRPIAVAFTVLLNAAFLIALDRLMHVPPASRQPPLRDVVMALQVRLIDADRPPMPAVSEAAPVPSVAQPRPSTVAPPRERIRERVATASAREATPAPARPDASAPSSALPLFDRTGAPVLPAQPLTPAPAEPANPLVHRDVLPYEPTRLDGAWPSVRETLGGELVRKTTVTKVWRNRYGTQVTCSGSLLVPVTLLACGWGHAPQATIDEIKAMRADPPPPRAAEDGSRP